MSSYPKHYPKRQYWQKSKSAGYAYHKPEPRKDMTPIPASAHSRTKLKAFQFVEGRPDGAPNQDDQDKENLSQSSKKSTRSQELKGKRSKPSSQAMLKTLSQEKVRQSVEEPIEEERQLPAGLSRSKTCPITTPKTRLPIADLVGNAEVASLHLEAKNPSPDEHIYWERAPSPRRSHPKGTPAAGKKRARSSSPAYGSQNEPPNSAVKDGADAGTLRRSMRTPMKTPKVDPAADLWNRYATTKDTPSNAKTPGVNQLLLDSSPRSDDTAGSVGGLRRWMSCGGQWPTSRTKRRKTSHFNLQPNDQTELFKDIGAMSKVGMLVERIQETLPRQSISREASNLGDPASSPLQVEPGASGGATSPLQRLGSITEDREETTNDHSSQVQQEKHPSKSSSDYGDFDSEMLVALEAKEISIGSQRNLNIHKSTFAGPTSQPKTEANQLNHFPEIEEKVSGIQAKTTLQAKVDEDDFDEFGDDDLLDEEIEGLCAQYDDSSKPTKQQKTSSTVQSSEGLLDEDMEELCAQYDTGNAETHGDGTTGNQAPGGDTSRDDSYHTAVAEQVGIDDNASDDFGGSDIDIEDFVAAEMAATQAPRHSHVESPGIRQNSSEVKSNPMKQYCIIEIVEGSCSTKSGPSSEKLLLVEEERSKRRKTITLRQSWYDSPCEPGFLVHVVGSFTGPRESECIIDDTHNMLILYPDHLLSATVVSDSFTCIRRAVLGDRVKATSNTNAPQMYGHMLHELFQEAMKANRWDSHWLEEKISTLLPRYFESMAEINTTEVRVMEHLRSKLPELQGWAKVFIKDTPGPDAVVEARGGEKVSLSINKLLDVEEHVWAPGYGLKGNIDATVQMVMKDSTGEKTLAVPLEVKTGKNSNVVSHSAQTALYTLLLSERYDIDIAYGILYYLESSKVIRVSALRREIIHMIKKRNEVACYARDRTRLPPMLENSHMCGKCFAQQPCFIYHKLLENGTDETIGPKGQFNELVRYLGPGEQTFFQKWDTLLTKEEGEVVKIKRELWTMMSFEREKVGRCFSNVVIEPGSAEELGEAAKINRYRYTFRKQQPSPGFSFTESQIAVGEPIVISDEKGHYALANGYITNVSRRSVAVAVDRRLHNARTKASGFDIDSNQVFAGIMEVTKEGMAPDPIPTEDSPTVYRIDKDEFSNGMATVRNNLIQLMDNNVYKSSELRTLIIHDRAPIFTPPSSAYHVQTESSQMSSNPDQKAAIEKVMSARDYALVLGMPGTGKTTTISQIIRALVAKGKSVLLASYTHTAVDNILLKIRHDNIGILRLGAISKVHPEVQQFAILGGQATTSLEELERNWAEPPVVATTCLGINHPIFARRVFDYCIVDEASQITLPVCLGPIRMAKTFVLVGDHYQLPPLVQNKEALDGGLDMSLFKYLCERQPSAVVSLSTQYRMCEDVMALANKLIYSGQLKCGNHTVANRSLMINPSTVRCALASCHWPSEGKPETSQGYRPFMPSTPSTACLSHSEPSCYLSRFLKPETRVLFLDTDALRPESHEQIAGQRIQNPTEAKLIASLVAALVGSGVPASDIGVVTFFRSQLALLRRQLQAHVSHRRDGGVELHTADRFQGRDKEIILVSCVRSNDNATVGELLKDWRRINVALTRARSKLVIVGSGETLSQGDPVLKGLVELCTERGWIMGLPKGAAESHFFEDASTQALTPSSRISSSSKKLASGKIFSQSQAQRDRGSPVKKSQAKGVAGGARKRPDKMGKMSKQVLGGRPILRDIVNEVLGDVGMEDL